MKQEAGWPERALFGGRLGFGLRLFRTESVNKASLAVSCWSSEMSR